MDSHPCRDKYSVHKCLVESHPYVELLLVLPLVLLLLLSRYFNVLFINYYGIYCSILYRALKL